MQTGTTAVLRMEIPTRRAPKSPALRRNRSSIHSRFITRNLCYSFGVRECSTVASPTTVPALLSKLGGGKNVSRCSGIVCVAKIPRAMQLEYHISLHIYQPNYVRDPRFAACGSFRGGGSEWLLSRRMKPLTRLRRT